MSFMLDEDRARELITMYLTEHGFEDDDPEPVTLYDFNSSWHRGVDDVCALVFRGDGLDVGLVPGALHGADGYGIMAYPLDYEDSCDVLITLRQEPAWRGSFVQVADISTEVRKLYDTGDGIDGLIAMCQNIVHEANRLKPYLDKIGRD